MLGPANAFVDGYGMGGAVELADSVDNWIEWYQWAQRIDLGAFFTPNAAATIKQSDECLSGDTTFSWICNVIPTFDINPYGLVDGGYSELSFKRGVEAGLSWITKLYQKFPKHFEYTGSPVGEEIDLENVDSEVNIKAFFMENDIWVPKEPNLDIMMQLPNFDEDDYVILDRDHSQVVGNNDDEFYF